jgi:hypothetical protein
MASNFYRAEDSPRCNLGHALELVFIGAEIIALLILMFNYKRSDMMQELRALGDRVITYRYFL